MQTAEEAADWEGSLGQMQELEQLHNDSAIVSQNSGSVTVGTGNCQHVVRL